MLLKILRIERGRQLTANMRDHILVVLIVTLALIVLVSLTAFGIAIAHRPH